MFSLASLLGGYGSNSMEDCIGFIPPSDPPKVKAKKYVQLLVGSGDDRVLMGEPSSFTTPYYSVLGDFTCQDLEYFAAFCGLHLLIKKSYGQLVIEAMTVSWG
jgi:hypothetical protein